MEVYNPGEGETILVPVFVLWKAIRLTSGFKYIWMRIIIILSS